MDLLAPYQRGGKIGLFGGAGVGKTVLIMELRSITLQRPTVSVLSHIHLNQNISTLNLAN